MKTVRNYSDLKHYSDLKKDYSDIPEQCRNVDGQEYRINELIKVTELKQILKKNTFYC